MPQKCTHAPKSKTGLDETFSMFWTTYMDNNSSRNEHPWIKCDEKELLIQTITHSQKIWNYCPKGLVGWKKEKVQLLHQ